MGQTGLSSSIRRWLGFLRTNHESEEEEKSRFLSVSFSVPHSSRRQRDRRHEIAIKVDQVPFPFPLFKNKMEDVIKTKILFCLFLSSAIFHFASARKKGKKCIYLDWVDGAYFKRAWSVLDICKTNPISYPNNAIEIHHITLAEIQQSESGFSSASIRNYKQATNTDALQCLKYIKKSQKKIFWVLFSRLIYSMLKQLVCI